MTLSSSIGKAARSPCACISGPPMPSKVDAGHQRPAAPPSAPPPSRSPDGSPAMRKTRSSCGALAGPRGTGPPRPAAASVAARSSTMTPPASITMPSSPRPPRPRRVGADDGQVGAPVLTRLRRLEQDARRPSAADSQSAACPRAVAASSSQPTGSPDARASRTRPASHRCRLVLARDHGALPDHAGLPEVGAAHAAASRASPSAPRPARRGPGGAGRDARRRQQVGRDVVRRPTTVKPRSSNSAMTTRKSAVVALRHRRASGAARAAASHRRPPRDRPAAARIMRRPGRPRSTPRAFRVVEEAAQLLDPERSRSGASAAGAKPSSAQTTGASGQGAQHRAGGRSPAPAISASISCRRQEGAVAAAEDEGDDLADIVAVGLVAPAAARGPERRRRPAPASGRRRAGR